MPEWSNELVCKTSFRGFESRSQLQFIMRETKTRTLTRVICWRFLSLIVTTVVLYVITNDLTLSVEASVIAHLIRLVLHFIHERLWLLVRWGERKK